MAKIYGNTTTTPIDPKKFGGSGGSITVEQKYNPESENAQSGIAVAEATSNKPTIHSGTEIFITVEDESLPEFNCGIFKPMGDTKWTPPYKVGDLYYNTESKQLCVCVETNEDNSYFSSNWRLASMLPEYEYNPKSGLAQSGIAVDQALEPYKYLQKDGGYYTHLDFLDVKYAAYVQEDLVVGRTAICEKDPTQDAHLTNKKYVDGLIGNIETALDNIIAIQNSLIGGDEV